MKTLIHINTFPVAINYYLFVTCIKGDEDHRNGKNHCGGMDLDDWYSDKKYVFVIQKLMKSRTIKMQGKGHPEVANYIL
jgi:hypothetical protein